MSENLSLLLDRKTNSQSGYGKEDLLPLVDNRKRKVVSSVSLVEKVLISKLKVGDCQAFSDIFTSYYPDLVLFAMRFTYDLNNAEEIVQDIFVKLWEEHESLIVNTSLKSYLLKMIQNKYIDWYRHKKIMQMHNNSVLEEPPQYEYDTDNYLLYSELQKQIEVAIIMLPEEVSEAFQMNRYKGLKYKEIADLLGISVRTVEVRIGKALHLLRNYLRGYLAFTIGFISLLF